MYDLLSSCHERRKRPNARLARRTSRVQGKNRADDSKRHRGAPRATSRRNPSERRSRRGHSRSNRRTGFYHPDAPARAGFLNVRWSPIIGIVGFDGGHKKAIALSTFGLNSSGYEQGDVGAGGGNPPGGGGEPPPWWWVPPVACCLGHECQMLTPLQCQSQGGTQQDDGIGCDPNPCEPPPPPGYGACCVFDGINYSCTVTLAADCGGQWYEGVGCGEIDCEQEGTCCSPSEPHCGRNCVFSGYHCCRGNVYYPCGNYSCPTWPAAQCCPPEFETCGTCFIGYNIACCCHLFPPPVNWLCFPQ